MPDDSPPSCAPTADSAAGTCAVDRVQGCAGDQGARGVERCTIRDADVITVLRDGVDGAVDDGASTLLVAGRSHVALLQIGDGDEGDAAPALSVAIWKPHDLGRVSLFDAIPGAPGLLLLCGGGSGGPSCELRNLTTLDRAGGGWPSYGVFPQGLSAGVAALMVGWNSSATAGVSAAVFSARHQPPVARRDPDDRDVIELYGDADAIVRADLDESSGWTYDYQATTDAPPPHRTTRVRDGAPWLRQSTTPPTRYLKPWIKNGRPDDPFVYFALVEADSSTGLVNSRSVSGLLASLWRTRVD